MSQFDNTAAYTHNQVVDIQINELDFPPLGCDVSMAAHLPSTIDNQHWAIVLAMQSYNEIIQLAW